ncbi:signal peptidase II [Streptomyces cuspidosporus]|uniref:Lipoprotein signal peptidase n=1 Tax=Streptomyces cuspidosporus TaxID=66882 RepID=A0ABN3G8S1_9ACTN
MKPQQRTGRVLFPLAALAVAVADQVSKAWAVAALGGTAGPQDQFGPVRTLLVRNTGVAFGLARGRPLLIVLITLAGALATLAAVGAGLRVRSRARALALGLIAGGALGNGADRAVRHPGPLRGAVIDWVMVSPRGPVFNLADAALAAGACLIVLVLLRDITLPLWGPRSRWRPAPRVAGARPPGQEGDSARVRPAPAADQPVPAGDRSVPAAALGPRAGPRRGSDPRTGCARGPRGSPRGRAAARAPLRPGPPGPGGRPARW